MREINQTSYSVVSIDEINQLAHENPQQLVEQSEAYYSEQLCTAAQHILERKHRVVLLSGPSASGKTTTAHKLREILDQSVGARVLSMDNFFKGIQHYDVLEDGTVDMESIQTMDVDYMNDCFEELFKKGFSDFPIFDFAAQSRSQKTQHVILDDDDVLIMEGIHALNPAILNTIDQNEVFRMYVSVRSKFMLGDETVLRPHELRLLRRLVRDYLFRNYSAVHTIEYWDHVLASEKVNIDPYRDAVDFKMDNTLDYEVCIWHYMLYHKLQQNVSDVVTHNAMGELLIRLKAFSDLDPKIIPQNSLLREFVGNE